MKCDLGAYRSARRGFMQQASFIIHSHETGDLVKLRGLVRRIEGRWWKTDRADVEDLVFPNLTY